MKTLFYFLFSFLTILVSGQVGINTPNPEATLHVVGRPDDPNHYDGIIPPSMTGDQLSKKIYSASKKGTLLFVTIPPYILSGQVINVAEPGLYYFDGSLWQPIPKQERKIEYQTILIFDRNTDSPLTASSKWSEPVNLWDHKDTYLTCTKFYSLGAKKFGALEGAVSFTKIEGIINIKFLVSRKADSEPVSDDVVMDISDICNEIGYFPTDVAWLHPENSTVPMTVFLQNNSIHIPAVTLNSISTNTKGEAKGYSSWTKPHLK
ncbi:hypothetical protein [Epilithonimonas mollis]|uniref:Uncharacterized protein n=1 Tax=Epilithonimonas mollis TaxID=216903 RepID=A0A1M6UGZ7_9FLAO|nr:hypothetical protein [Epilithonimonas mollis]SHK68431.1 hypothetical protein SAMN05444371_3279 [Epilithonimonas mollis]